MVCSKKTDGLVYIAHQGAGAAASKIIALNLKTGEEKVICTANKLHSMALNHDESVLFIAQEIKVIAFNLETATPTV